MPIKHILRSLARKLSTWPMIGRLVRITIAVIRLPEERVLLKQMILEQSLRLQKQADDLAAIGEKLSRHEIFITSQVPRFAQKITEISRIS